jgi:hypothetical protein
MMVPIQCQPNARGVIGQPVWREGNSDAPRSAFQVTTAAPALASFMAVLLRRATQGGMIYYGGGR